MSSRTTQFFMLRNEFSDFVAGVASELQLVVMETDRSNPAHLGIVTADALDHSDPAIPLRLYFSDDRPGMGAIDRGTLTPGQFGWVQADAPQEVDDVLLLGQFASKSDFLGGDNQAYENQACHRLHSRITAALAKELDGPIWAWNVLGGPPHCYRDIGYSTGARDWVSNRGLLKQEGVENVVFSTKAPAGRS